MARLVLDKKAGNARGEEVGGERGGMDEFTPRIGFTPVSRVPVAKSAVEVVARLEQVQQVVLPEQSFQPASGNGARPEAGAEQRAGDRPVRVRIARQAHHPLDA